MDSQQFSKHAYRNLALLAVGILIVGTVFYHLVEHFSWLNAYYFSVITLATVGYGDLTPHTAAGKLFTTFYIFAGAGVVTTFITFTLRRQGAKAAQRQKARQERKGKL